MKSSVSLPLAVVFATTLLAPGFASAQPQGGSRGAVPPDGSRQVDRDSRLAGPEGSRRVTQRRQAARLDLGLTDVQKADIAKARQTARRARLQKSTDMKIARMDLSIVLRADTIDEAAVAAKLAQAQAAQAALLKLRVDTALAMKRILTPEQQKMMSEARTRNRGMNRRHRQMRSPRGSAPARGRSSRDGRPADPTATGH